MIKYLRLNQEFRASKMQEEVMRIEQAWWKQHYNKGHYEGGWTALPLRSAGGSTENIIAIHAAGGNRLYEDTPLLKNCPSIKRVLDFFQCEKTTVRLMKLDAGGVIKEHRDQELSFEEGEVRFHIPIVTNPEVKFFLQEERIVMNEGECWYLNLSLPHSVQNNGLTSRVHLVMDCTVNDWIRDLFAGALLQKHIEKEEKKYPKEDQLKIIKELRLLNTPTSLELAARMEKELE